MALTVSLSIKCNESPYESFRLFELGQHIFASILLDLHSDLSELYERCPDLAIEFDIVRRKLDALTSNRLFWLEVVEPMWFDTVINKFRKVKGSSASPGDSEFELMSLAGKGPIVAFNVSRLRSNTLLITNDNISGI